MAGTHFDEYFRYERLTTTLRDYAEQFPALLRLRPVAGSAPPQFEVAEIVNLQQVREEARKKR